MDRLPHEAADAHNGSMREPLLPLFPLSLVLLPSTPLPLHIFEERYKEMIEEAVENQSEFGVVLLMPQGLAQVGCSARITGVLGRYEDGRLNIQTEGRHRFEIVSADNSRSFLRAKVRFFDDEPQQAPVPPELFERVLRGYYALRTLDSNLPELHLNDDQLSFQFGQAADDHGFRQRLLQSLREVERLELLDSHFAQILPQKRHVARIKKAAPANGHSKHPPVIQ